MSFVITGLPVQDFRPLFSLSDLELAARGVVRQTVAEKPGAPCRITLEDAEPGETVLLLNHTHQPADTPYRASHAIFVRESATDAVRYEDEIPQALARRLIALRAFDAGGMMIDADIVEGTDLAPLIERFLAEPATAYLHAHYARRGCFAARIDRG